MNDNEHRSDGKKRNGLFDFSKPPNLEKFVSDILKNKNIIQFGMIIAKARRRLGLNQAQLGVELWKDKGISPSAAQTRIYRVENGIQELDIKTTSRLLDILRITNINPVTLRPFADDDGQWDMMIDKKAFLLYPNLHHYFKLINECLRMDDLKQAKLVLKAMYQYLINTPPQPLNDQ